MKDMLKHKFIIKAAVAAVVTVAAAIMVIYGINTGNKGYSKTAGKEEGSITKDELVIFIKLMCPVAPHICEEIWESLGGEGLLSLSAWPEYDESKCVDAEIEIAVQICGKLKGTITIPVDSDKDVAIAKAKELSNVAAAIEGKTIVKEIYVPNKIVNIVAK